MSVKNITTGELRRMKGKEGLILQGCGGDLQEWVNGINETLMKEGVLLDDTKFKNCSMFKYDGHTCILFPFDDVKVDIGRFSVWRIRTNANFGSTWLSDFIENYLGGYMVNKTEEIKRPNCPLIGQDGNIFNLIGIASRTLKHSGLCKQAEEMTERIINGAGSYYEALNIIGEYVNITSVDDEEAEDYDEGMEISL